VPVYTEDDARQLLVGEVNVKRITLARARSSFQWRQVGTTVELTLTSPRLGEGMSALSFNCTAQRGYCAPSGLLVG